MKGILLVINSGGGQSGASELIFREVKSLARTVPIVTVVMSLCCSGAYKIAIGSHWIVAPSAAQVGSIGAVLVIERYKNTHVNTKEGITADVDYEVISSGKYKAIYHPENRPLNEQEWAFIQANVEACYKIFYSMLAQERRLSLDSIADWADGKVFTGDQALEKKLIDEVGGYSDAMRALKRLMLRSGTISFIE